ncbi:MAG: tryptophan synthase subunit alpha [Armatimonadota bacterium]
MRGKEAVRGAFQQARAEGRAALVLYWPLGYPDLETSIAVVVALAQAGADALELGVPFSDPLADGPTIQRATHRALQHGVRTPAVLEAVARIRGAGVRQALCLMTYVNPVLAWGLSAFMEAARRAGGDGVILPDVPLEESAPFRAAAEAAGLAWVPLAAPTTPERRLWTSASTPLCLWPRPSSSSSAWPEPQAKALWERWARSRWSRESSTPSPLAPASPSTSAAPTTRPIEVSPRTSLLSPRREPRGGA